jgi:AraC family transcriptional regulator, transcriptional activator of pobA
MAEMQAAKILQKMIHTPGSIRISHLSQPFVYKKMEDIEAARSQREAPELPHRHDFFTVIAVEISDGGIHQIDFKNHPLSAHTLYFVAPEQVHNITLEGRVEGHVVMFTSDFLLRHSLPPEQLTGLGLFFNCDEARPLVLTAAAMQDLNLYFRRFDSETRASGTDRWEVLGAWLKLFLLEVNRLKAQVLPATPKVEHRQAIIVRQFKSEIEKHFARWHHVADYADAQHLTANYLNEVIRSETGTTAKDFILNRIILEAKRLAQYSDLTAKEVAHQLGYEDAAQFSKLFKKSTGSTFSEFREK